MIRRWVSWVVGRPVPVIVSLLAITVALAWRLPTLNREIDIRKLLPPDHPYVVIHHRIEREFGGRNLTAIAVIPRNGDAWQPAVLRKVKAITDEALKLPGVIQQSVVSLSSPNVRSFEDRGGGVAIEYLMRDVPETPEAIAALRAKAEAIAPYRGMLVTPDGKAAMVLLDFWSDRTMREIADVVEPFARGFSDDDVAVRYAGAPAVLGEISRELMNMQAWFGISFAAIAVALYFSFGTVQGALLPLATALLAVAWGVGLMAWSKAPMDAWSGVTPILIMAVAAGHSAQILKRYHEEYERLGDSVAAVVESTSRIGPVMLAAGSTASLGFLSLVLFRVPSLRNFALYTALGIVAAMILELSFIPACRSLLRPPRRDARHDHGGLLERLLAATARQTSTPARAARMVGFWLVAIVLAGAGILAIDADSSFKRFMPPQSDLRKNVDAVERHFAGTTPLVIEVEGSDGALQDPSTLRYVADLSAELRNDPAVAKVTSVADLVEYANLSVGAGPGAVPALPNDRQQIAQLLLLTYSPPYERFLDRSYSRAAIWALLRSDHTIVVDTVIQRAKRFAAAHRVPSGVTVSIAGGMGAAAVAINEETTRGKAWNVALLYLVILVVGSVLLRSPTGGLLIVVPLAVSLVVDLGLLGAAGIELDLTTASILSIGVAIGADYAIYLIYRAREEIGKGAGFEQGLERMLLTSGKAVWFVAFAIAGGYAILTPFSFRPLRLCATLIPVAMVVACATAVTLIPSLLALVRPRFLSRRAIVDAIGDSESWRLSA